jgi:hypothetical protein
MGREEFKASLLCAGREKKRGVFLERETKWLSVRMECRLMKVVK